MLIVFLGNRGTRYKNTRHNIGFSIADRIYPYADWQAKFHGLLAKENPHMIFKPMMLMNRSGIPVSEAARFFRLKPEEIVVVHDDLELEFGEIDIRLGGGLRGHNGLRSIKERIGSDRFYRIRTGIGRPPHQDVAHWVLSPLRKEEIAELDDLAAKIKKEIYNLA